MTFGPTGQFTPSENTTSYAARNDALRQENTRLKELVVKLSAIIVKNVAAQCR